MTRRTAEDGDRQRDDETEADDFGACGGALYFTTLPWEAFHRRMSSAGVRIESGTTIADALRKCNAPRQRTAQEGG